MGRERFNQLILNHPQISNYLCSNSHITINSQQEDITDGDIDEESPLIDRIIYLDGRLLSKQDLSIEPSFLPEGTKEVLWVHPINLDFSEVLS